MRGRTGALAFLILAIVSCARIASAEELLRIEGGPSLLDLIRQRQARERGETPAAPAETIEAYLSKPDGNGPFPARRLSPRLRWAFKGDPPSHRRPDDGLGLRHARRR
jgi:hypothetical protein